MRLLKEGGIYRSNVLPGDEFEIPAHRRESGVKLSRGLAREIQELANNYSDLTELADLRLAPSSLKKDRHWIYGYRSDPNSPVGWKKFHCSLDRTTKRLLSKVLEQAILGGFHTIGNIRDADIDQLRIPKKLDGSFRLSDNQARFLKQAFTPLPYEGALQRKGGMVVFK